MLLINKNKLNSDSKISQQMTGAKPVTSYFKVIGIIR